MRQQENEQELIRRYLLGSLSDEQANHVEEVEARLLLDGKFEGDVRAGEDELIDDYVFGLLNAGERKSFEQHFLSAPGRSEKLRFARAVKEYLGDDTAREEQNVGNTATWWQALARPDTRRRLLTGGVLATFVVAAIVIFFVWKGSPFRRDNRDSITRAEIEREVSRWTKAPRSSFSNDNQVATVDLAPGEFRDPAGARRVVITRDTIVGELVLKLTDQRFASYEATLLTEEDVVVFKVGSLGSQEYKDGNLVLILRIPAKSLPAGDYLLSLQGILPNGQTTPAVNYPFQVIHKTRDPGTVREIRVIYDSRLVPCDG